MVWVSPWDRGRWHAQRRDGCGLQSPKEYSSTAPELKKWGVLCLVKENGEKLSSDIWWELLCIRVRPTSCASGSKPRTSRGIYMKAGFDSTEGDFSYYIGRWDAQPWVTVSSISWRRSSLGNGLRRRRPATPGLRGCDEGQEITASESRYALVTWTPCSGLPLPESSPSKQQTSEAATNEGSSCLPITGLCPPTLGLPYDPEAWDPPAKLSL